MGKAKRVRFASCSTLLGHPASIPLYDIRLPKPDQLRHMSPDTISERFVLALLVEQRSAATDLSPEDATALHAYIYAAAQEVE